MLYILYYEYIYIYIYYYIINICVIYYILYIHIYVYIHIINTFDSLNQMWLQLQWLKITTPGLHYKIPVFSDPAPGKS